MPDEFIVIACSDMKLADELFSRIANTLEGSYVYKDDRIPIFVIKNDWKNIMRIRDFLVVLMTIDKEFIGRLMFLERKDLI